MRVDDPTLSIVAMRRRLVSLSGAKVSMTFQRPLNSSISAMSLRISGVIVMFLISCMGAISIFTHLYPFHTRCTGTAEIKLEKATGYTYQSGSLMLSCKPASNRRKFI